MLLHNLRTIGEKLYGIRQRYGWTQLEAATNADVSDKTYASMEHGTLNVRLETLLNICEALHITPDEILTDDRGRVALREKEILSRLQASTPHVKETALRLIDTYLSSIQE